MYRAYAQEHTARINLGIRRRLAPLLEDAAQDRADERAALLAAGDARPLLRRRDRDGRQHLSRRPQRRAHADAVERRPQRRLLAGEPAEALSCRSSSIPSTTTRRSTSRRSSNNPRSLLWWMKRLIAPAQAEQGASAAGRSSSCTRTTARCSRSSARTTDERLLVVANLSRYAQHVELDLARFEGMVPVELFGRSTLPGDHEPRLLPVARSARLLLVHAGAGDAGDLRGRRRGGSRDRAEGLVAGAPLPEGRKVLEPALEVHRGAALVPRQGAHSARHDPRGRHPDPARRADRGGALPCSRASSTRTARRRRMSCRSASPRATTRGRSRRARATR